jgi:hypothetical protein
MGASIRCKDSRPNFGTSGDRALDCAGAAIDPPTITEDTV